MPALTKEQRAAKLRKERRDSRGPLEIRNDHDRRSEMRRSQLSQSMVQLASTVGSSSSSSSAIHNDEPAVRARKSKFTACRQVAPRMNNEGVDRIERRARAIAAVRDHISGINLNRQPIQDEIDVPTQDRIDVPMIPRRVPVAINAEQQILNAEIRRERLLAAVRNRVLNIDINYPQIVDPLLDLIDPVEKIFNAT